MSALGETEALPSKDHLFAVGERLPLRRYLAEAWRRKDLAIVVPRERFWSSTSETMLGSLWHFLTPVLHVVVFWLIFGILLDADRGVPNTLSFIATGVFTFNFSQQMIMGGTRSITSNRVLIQSIYFPRILLPAQALVAQCIELLPSTGVMLVFVVATNIGNTGGDEIIYVQWIAYPLIMVGLGLFSFGAALASARLNTVVQDYANVLPFVFRITNYASGVIFPVATRIGNETARSMMEITPWKAYLDLTRWSILGYSWSTRALIAAVLWALVTPVVGLLIFARGEHTYGRG